MKAFGNFGVVPFLDAGNIYTSPLPNFSDLRFGTGLGVRYYSTFGPIRVDVGTTINQQTGDPRIAVYVSLGQAFVATASSFQRARRRQRGDRTSVVQGKRGSVRVKQGGS